MTALRRCRLFALVVCVLAAPTFASEHRPLVRRAAAGALEIVPARSAAEPAPKHGRLLSFDDVSRRRLLSSGGEAPGAVDTVRVLLVRVSFETDREDALSSLATGGGFDLTSGGTSLIDPTPHDRGYFDSHMRALSNYYRFQSCGRLEIVWDVLPEGENESYLVGDLADYGPGTGGSWSEERLVRFFRDCAEAADRALAGDGYPKRFGDYDAVVVAHAGANLQSDVSYDTPNDVPSFFASLDAEERFTVDGGATVIEDGCVIAETAAQDGRDGGIAAILAHEFGHQLGLPDLYDTAAPGTVVGYWDLMDAGMLIGADIEDGDGHTRYAEGFLPPGLSAWSRSLLGWGHVDRVSVFDGSIALPAVERCPARAVRVEAASDEYFLVENRAGELDGIPTVLVVDENGVIVGAVNVGAPSELVNAYDALLPREPRGRMQDGGPGLLIWHVDERLVSERLAENALNASRPFAVSLLEAGGTADLGNPASASRFGSYDDAYFAGNNSTLSDSTSPPSWSTWGVPTGVKIEDIGVRDTLMSFGAGVREIVGSLTLPGGIAAARNGFLSIPGGAGVIVDEAGRGWVPGSESPAFDLGAPAVAPVALDEADYGTALDPMPAAVVIGDSSGTIHKLRPDVWSELEGWPLSLGAALSTHPVVARRGGRSIAYLVLADVRGRLHVLDEAGREVPGCPLDFVDPIVSPNDGILGNVVVEDEQEPGGRATAIYVLSGGLKPSPHAWLSKWEIGEEAGSTELLRLSSGYPCRVLLDEDDLAGEIALAGGDAIPDEPGGEVYIACLASGRIALCGTGGVISTRARESRIVAPPAALDLNGDSMIDLLYSDGLSVYAISPSGANCTGWPRSLVAEYGLPWRTSVSAPLTAVGGARDETAVVVGTNEGLLYLFDSVGRLVGDAPTKVSSGIMNAVEIGSEEGLAVLVYADGDAVRSRRPRAGAEPSAAWGTMCGSAERTAWARASAASPAADGWLGLERDLVVYPNPSTGERVGFHFKAPVAGEARIEIMNLAGELVLSSRKRLTGGEDEFVVSLADKASGVYVVRIVVESEGRSVSARRSFAIVR